VEPALVYLSATLVALVAASPLPHITGLLPSDRCPAVPCHRHDGAELTSSVCEGPFFSGRSRFALPSPTSPTDFGGGPERRENCRRCALQPGLPPSCIVTLHAFPTPSPWYPIPPAFLPSFS